MMNAYDKDYLYHAQKNFAHMTDFAVNTCGFDIDEYFTMFLASDVCTRFENGNPNYIVGKTGCELARLVVREIKDAEIPVQDIMYSDKSPEYWFGWALCYYVWIKNHKFAYVLSAVSAGDMLGMYDTMHEADITKFVSALDGRLSEHYKTTALTRMRTAYGLSQAELAERSNVNIRVIQSYEQRLRNINKARISTVVRLAKALDCDPEELMDASFLSDDCDEESMI
ncbi:MAG: helix-turn-helix transcriptional regulator [Oscillospiraceae bacterium]|nr:helix-turn-helix transcriptional regulator [Oscillospiraceae bacterium]